MPSCRAPAWWLAVLLPCWTACRPTVHTEAQDGVLDLTGEQWFDGPVAMDGEWRLVRGKLVPPDQTMADAPLVDVPADWPDDPGHEPGAFGHGTYSLVVRLPAEGGPFSIRTGRTYTASAVFVDGRKVTSSGRLGDDRSTTKPSLEPRIVELPPGAEAVELRVWVANFHGYKGGLRKIWTVGPTSEVLRSTARSALLATLLASFLGVVAVLSFLMWLAERRGTDKLWFAGATLVTAIRSGVGGDAHVVYLLLPRASWSDVLQVEFITDFLAPAFALALITRMFKDHAPRRLSEAVQVANLVLAVVCVFLPSHILGQLVPLVGLSVGVSAVVGTYMLVVAARAHAPQARLLLFSVVVLTTTAAHDVAIAMGLWTSSFELLGWGFVALVSTEAYALARIFADSARRIEQLSADISAAHNDLMRTHEAVVCFVPYAFLDLLGRSSIVDVQRGDHVSMDVEVLFCDIRGYTTLVEGLTPSEAFGLINEWLGTLEPHVHEGGGFIKEYLGDCIVAVFPSGPDDALRSCIRMHEALRRFSDEQTFAPGRTISAGMGLHAGPIIMGTIGGDTRLDTGAVGDVVNTTSRIEGLTRTYGTDLLVSESIVGRIRRPEDFLFRALDTVVVKGRVEALRIYECLDALPDDIRARRLTSLSDYDAGRSALEEGDVETARQALQRCLEVDPEDVSARILLDRCG